MAERFTAAQADVEWRANTGQAEVDIEKLRRVFTESTSQMSTHALKLASAQDKLDRALVKHGPSSRQARDAEIQYRQALDHATTAANRNSAALGHQDRQLERVGRGALVGSGALRGFARAAVFASTSFLGAAGLTYALRTSVDAASNLAEQTSKAEQVFGKSAPTIIRWGKNTATSIGIANDKAIEAAGTFGNLFNTVGLLPERNAQLSRSLVQLAADLASFNNASPEEALDALRSGLIGEAEPLRRFGVLLSENRVKQEALRETGKKNAQDLTDQEKLLARYALILKDTGKAQGDFARTQDGQANSQRQLTAEIRDTEAAIGKALLPSVRHITHAIRDWLGDARNQRRLQHDVNEVVRTGGKVAHGLARGLEDIETVAEPLVDVLGGVENAAKLMIEAFVLYKLVKIAGAIRAIGLGARFSRREITLLNETPVLPKGVPGGGPVVVPGGQTPPGGGVILPPGTKTPTPPGFKGSIPGGTFGAAIIAGLLAYTQQGEAGQHIGGPLDITVGPGAGDTVSYRDPVNGKYHLIHVDPSKPLGPQIAADILRRHPDYVKPTTAGTSTEDRQPGRSPQGPGAPSPGAERRRHHQRPHDFAVPYRYQIEEARAATAGQDAQLKAAQDELSYVKAEIASGKLTKQGLLDAYQEEQRLEDEISGIKEDRQRRRDERARKEHEQQQRRREREREQKKQAAEDLRRSLALEEKRLQNQVTKAQLTASLADDKKAYADLIHFYRQEEHDRRLSETAREDYLAKELRARKAQRARKKASDAASTDLLSAGTDLFRTYGSNLFGRGEAGSSQEAIALLAKIAQLVGQQVEHSKTTAHHTARIGKRAKPGSLAGDFAGQGL